VVDRLVIRELGPGDEPLLDVLARESSAFEDGEAERDPRPLAAHEGSAFLDDPSTHLWVALADDTVVGFLLAYVLRRRRGDPTQLFVYELGVRSGWRRQGVATRLVRHMLTWARGEGLRRGFVLTGADNAAAIEFYGSLGWRAEDETDVVFSFAIEDRG
jgi:GNAT superfamily N-acetyltransferase